MTVTLKPEMAAFVAQQVSSGHFSDESEVVNGGLQVLRDLEDFSPAELDRLRREIAVGISQADAGQFVDFDAASIKKEARRFRSDGMP